MIENSANSRSEKELLFLALATPPEDLQKLLDDICQGDTNLRERVQDLLHNAQSESEFMAGPAMACDLTTSIRMTASGERIGRYKLREKIGEGGMGVVFVAEQTEPVRRTVALKLIKPGMDSKQVIARFEAERQALAMMDHSNIAKVLDAGTTDAGLPFFVMELVRGLPITDYCDQAKLSPKDRLQLFQKVCSAIQHAHLKGIIHRDIKPNNVLVTLHDGVPVVKVIDFGVAKALHQQLTQHTVYTALNQVMGTPMYMSPEQLELSGLDVDTRTDIYSLGVLLYELLTGVLPFDRDELYKSGFDELRRIIREQDPPRPSLRVTTLDERAKSTNATRRGLDQRTFSRTYRGELDWIVMKALEKDRNRRYESASAMAKDVQRYLNDEPIEAKSPSFMYLLQKLVQKNRRYAYSAIGIGIALLIGTAVSIGFAVQASIDRDRAKLAEEQAGEKQRLAQQDFERAIKSIDDIMTGIGSRDVIHLDSATLIKSVVLDKVVRCYDEFARAHPEDNQARLVHAKALLRFAKIQDGFNRPDALLTEKALAIAEKLAMDFPQDRDIKVTLLWAILQHQDAVAQHLSGAEFLVLTQRAWSIANPLLASCKKESELRMLLEPLYRLPRSFPNDSQFAKKSFQRIIDESAQRGYRPNPTVLFSLADILEREGDSSAPFELKNQGLKIFEELKDHDIFDESYGQERIHWDFFGLFSYGLAVEYSKRGNIDEAERLFVTCFDKYASNRRKIRGDFGSGDSIRVFFNQFIEHTQRHQRQQQGGELLTTLVSKYPESEIAHELNARMLAMIHGVGAEFKRSIDRYPSQPIYHCYLALQLEKEGKLDEAREEARQAIGLISKGSDESSEIEEKMSQASPALREQWWLWDEARCTTKLLLEPQAHQYYAKRAKVRFHLLKVAEAIEDVRDYLARTYDVAILSALDTNKLADSLHKAAKADFLKLIHEHLLRNPDSFRFNFHAFKAIVPLGDSQALRDILADLAGKNLPYLGEVRDVYFVALASLSTGDKAGYQRACRQAATSLTNSMSVDKQLQAVWTCTIAPAALEDFGPVVGVIESIHFTTSKTPDSNLRFGAILVRAAQYERALSILNAIPDDVAEDALTADPYVHYFRAIAHFELKQTVESLTAIRKADELADRELSTTPIAWNRRATLLLLKSEAAELRTKIESGTKSKE